MLPSRSIYYGIRKNCIPSKYIASSARLLNTRSSNQNSENGSDNYKTSLLALCGCLATTAAGLYHYLEKSRRNISSSKFSLTAEKFEGVKNESHAGDRIDSLPQYTASDISKHCDDANRVWVSYRHGVYDITDFISKHPGSKDVIMEAAGGSIQPFWTLYAFHKNHQYILDMLEKYRVGNLDPNDVIPDIIRTKDFNPFENEPDRSDSKLIPSSSQPYNAEPSLGEVVKHFITPNDVFYVRNHLPVPKIDASDYKLNICTGQGDEKTDILSLTLDELKSLPKTTVTATIQCGGNRRSEMKAVRDLKGLEWKGAAIGNAEWSGVLLSDVLKKAGVSEEVLSSYKHVQFEGYDCTSSGDPYGASVPIHKLTDPNGQILLAYEMNNRVLPLDHGYPIRVVIPGYVGARSVKWLDSVVLSDEESKSHWQQNDYKGFSPHITWDNVDFSKSPAIQVMPVTSSICEPPPSSTSKLVPDKDGYITFKGYAWSGGGNKVIRVDLTLDRGKSWFEADLLEQDVKVDYPKHYGWTLWSAKIHENQLKKDSKNDVIELWSKAVDSSYNVQPESFDHIWNLRGLLSNAYSKVEYLFS